jgi:branched-chain amino acid transport system ATP-binding protein
VIEGAPEIGLTATDSADPILAIEGVSKRFGGVQAAEEITFNVRAHSITSLIGPNGAGKTTMFNMISGLVKPDAGSIRFDGKVVTGWSAHRIAQWGLVRTFQNVRLFSHLTALENVALGRYCRTKAGIVQAIVGLGRDRSERRDTVVQAERLLHRLGIWSKRNYLPAELPYGEQRRLEIARGLAAEPKLLALDEPTAGMNSSEANQLMDIIYAVRGDGVSVVLIEHNMNVVMDISDHVVVLSFGQKIAEGSPDVVRRDSKVIEAYLGTDE